MLKSIANKEWLKLRFYFFGLLLIIIASLGYFWFNLDFDFSTIEPESMLWYKFAHLQDKPYYYLSYLFISIGAIVSLAQFLPEKIQNRIKIMAHLPLSLRDSLFFHLFIGAVFVAILCTILSISLLAILANYYPQMIMEAVFKDTIGYSFASIVLYIALSSVILESKPIVMVFKFILLALFAVSFLKEQFTAADTIWILFLLFIPFMALDSFYSVKQQRLEHILFKASAAVVILMLAFSGYLNYKQNCKKEFNKYYIFYSNIIKDFVYQKNYGKHQFEYGIKDKKTFDRLEYESFLPFVYWRNLDIQKKLPVVIDGTEFDKQTIKKSRLGFSYTPAMLKQQEVQFYPLLNPNSKKGMMVFPEEMFGITAKKAVIYDYDNGLNKELSDILTKKLEAGNFTFPAIHIWGKATNMKPYDKGYLLQDKDQKLFNISRLDGEIKVKNIPYPKGIELAHIKLSENKQKILSGYAIDTKSNFYLLTWDFKFIKLDLPGFDYKNMKLKLISNPLNYLIRYDNGKNYYAVVFTKEYQEIESVELE